MGLSKAITLVFTGTVFKIIITVLILALIGQSTVRDYAYVEDISRIDSVLIKLDRLSYIDTISADIITLNFKVDSLYQLYDYDFKRIKRSNVKLAPAEMIYDKFDQVSKSILELGALIKTQDSTVKNGYKINIKPVK